MRNPTSHLVGSDSAYTLGGRGGGGGGGTIWTGSAKSGVVRCVTEFIPVNKRGFPQPPRHARCTTIGAIIWHRTSQSSDLSELDSEHTFG